MSATLPGMFRQALALGRRRGGELGEAFRLSRPAGDLDRMIRYARDKPPA